MKEISRKERRTQLISVGYVLKREEEGWGVEREEKGVGLTRIEERAPNLRFGKILEEKISKKVDRKRGHIEPWKNSRKRKDEGQGQE